MGEKIESRLVHKQTNGSVEVLCRRLGAEDGDFQKSVLSYVLKRKVQVEPSKEARCELGRNPSQSHFRSVEKARQFLAF